MAPDYYNGYGGGPSGKRRRSLVMRLVDLALTLVTLAVGATMVLTYFVPYVDPGSVWFFPVLGLAAPAVYVASVVLTLYWIIRWRWVCAGAMLVVVVAGLLRSRSSGVLKSAAAMPRRRPSTALLSRL